MKKWFGFLAQAACMIGAVSIVNVGVAGVAAEGGDEVYFTKENDVFYRVHLYRTPGSQSFGVTDGGTVELLLVGGGGGGGGKHMGGGGGAGGFVFSNALTVVAGSNYTVVVGTGGTGGAGPDLRGATGGNSGFDVLTAYGGGGGGSWNKEWGPAPRAAAPRATTRRGARPCR